MDDEIKGLLKEIDNKLGWAMLFLFLLLINSC